jgi:dynein heavy chain
VLKEFKAILGKELKQVTGSSDTIDAVSARVNEQIRKLVNFPNDVFNPEHLQDWSVAYGQFVSSIEAIETETTNLIQTTFEHKLSSSENAFDLLSKFKHLETRPAIKTELESKYTNVLDAYNRELAQMEQLYNKYQHNCPIPKNMPPRSGSIAWARSIITRIKTPIDKFTTKPEILTEF